MTMITININISGVNPGDVKVDVSEKKNPKCPHPKRQVWQYPKYWLCCRCWHQEEGHHAYK